MQRKNKEAMCNVSSGQKTRFLINLLKILVRVISAIKTYYYLLVHAVYRGAVRHYLLQLILIFINLILQSYDLWK